MMHRFERDVVEPMPESWRAIRRPCPYCEMERSHLGVSYGVSVKRDGSQVPIRVVMVEACEWHAWQWSRGMLAKP